MPVVKKTRKENGTLRVQFRCEGKSLTEQSHKGECDINKIMAKYQRTGLWPERLDTPRYGDFSSEVSFHDTMNKVREAEEDFMSLPPDIRSRFNQDPGELIGFLSDPENREEAIELGLLPDPEKEQQVLREASPGPEPIHPEPGDTPA